MSTSGEKKRVIALAGNPNVGKSTVFNELTGMKQHTGNWPGKTVSSASGTYTYKYNTYEVVDLPGTYSLLAHSPEEEVARDFICFGKADAVLVVVDATCIERNLNLVLQSLEITSRVVVCLNLMDEAKKKQIFVDAQKLSDSLGVPVVCATARSGKGINQVLEQLHLLVTGAKENTPCAVRYLRPIEEAVALLEPEIRSVVKDCCNSRFLALRLLEEDASLTAAMQQYLGLEIGENVRLAEALRRAKSLLRRSGLAGDAYKDKVVAALVQESERIAGVCVRFDPEKAQQRDRRIDRLFTSKITGIPIMLLLLAFIFWLTITFSNYPSGLLQKGVGFCMEGLHLLAEAARVPNWLSGLLIDGMFQVLGWVVAVMLPPMAIFFPLFTLLEDFGYLPRVAFNLDHQFRKASTCGKQALTTCMGFGCNAAAVTGARIIDSPRERLIAILTNSFTPCNGRFPLLIAMLSMFFVGSVGGAGGTLLSTLLLVLLILFSLFMTFAVSRLLSRTLLKGIPSSFTLELPPYRRPQIGKVILRSILDRTLFVLGRAMVVAAPAGIVIWLLANIHVDDCSLLQLCSNFLDPLGRMMGMDGVIVLAFLLAFPANEIVLPIILMAYLASGSLVEYESLSTLKAILVEHGWTWTTAVSVMLFSILHWPCSTTCLTIRKETKSWKWTAVSVLVPTVCGVVVCTLFHLLILLFAA